MRKSRHKASPRSEPGAGDRSPGCRRFSWLLFFSASLLLSPLVEPALAAASVREFSAVREKGTDQQLPDSRDPQHPDVVRWSESLPGCTFSRGEDGKYSYGLWAGDIGVILAVDARELELVRHRIEPILGVLLTLRYRGSGGLDATPDGITMEFVKHFKVVQPVLDPDSYSQKIQADADAVDNETRWAIKKHPDERAERIAGLQEYQKSADELVEFLNSRSLRSLHLDRATPQARGWVFFSVDNKWIGNWKSQEEFVLRFPLAGKVFEFPFQLPPAPGELLLRKRQ
jgi:hypothetical protein